MKNFAYYSTESIEAAANALQKMPSAAVKAGGTDLMDLLKERRLEPDDLVTLHRAARTAKENELSALATLEDVVQSDWIRKHFPAVHVAAAEAATPQVRHVGTVGGNLCQHTRCCYYRNANYSCHLSGGTGCPAIEEGAFNRYHAIFPASHCASAHTSNLAPALIAVGAKARCVHPDGNRTLDVELLYEGDAESARRNHMALRTGELIEAIELEPTPLSRNSVYVEFRERQSFDFAVAAVAAAVQVEGGKVKAARIVCGAVAPTPYRAVAAEKAMIGRALDPAATAKAVVKGAQPLAQNKFKVVILERMVQRALEELA